MKKPIIGIPSKHSERPESDLWHRLEMVDEIRLLITRHGGIGIMLLPSQNTLDFNMSDLGDDTILSDEEIADLKRQVDLCDGIILQGGNYSNQYEVEIARYALEKDIPLLGICAGFNNILRALGSNIYEDETKAHSHYSKEYRHNITVDKNSKLYEFIGSEHYKVNSLHTMIANKDNIKDLAKIVAYSDDGLVEAIEVEDKKFVLGVKWHPELMMDEEYVDKMFKAYIKACMN